MQSDAILTAARQHLRAKGVNIHSLKFAGILPQPGSCSLTLVVDSTLVKEQSFTEYLDLIHFNDAFCQLTSFAYLGNKQWNIGFTFNFARLVRF